MRGWQSPKNARLEELKFGQRSVEVKGFESLASRLQGALAGGIGKSHFDPLVR